MGFVNTRLILKEVARKNIAVGAYNVYNLETAKSIIETCNTMGIPAIIQLSEGAIKYGGGETLAKLIINLAERTNVPISLHLDHGKSKDVVIQAIRWGFSSVMIDASSLPFEGNLKLTKEVVEICKPAGVTVEAELGKIGGTEENISVSKREAFLVDPEEAEIFVKETGIDFLAPAIGTSHGAFKFKGEATLAIDRLKEVKKRTNIPLVLHGASSLPEWLLREAKKSGIQIPGAKGLPYEELQKAVKNGINKVNTDTDIRIAFLTGMRNYLFGHPDIIDPRKAFLEGMLWISRIVKERNEKIYLLK